MSSLKGFLSAGMAAVFLMSPPQQDRPYFSEPEPRPRRKPKGPSGPIIDSTPLTKREKRKLRRKT